jgi:folate-binding protein YgfZ
MQIFPHPHRALLLISGADRVSFLQGQLTQDVATLEPERTRLSAVLTPQGRVLAVALLAQLDDSIVMTLPAQLVAAIAERLHRYVLRAKVRITVPGEALEFAAALEEQPGEFAARFGEASVGRSRRLADRALFVRLAGGALLLAPRATLAGYLNAELDVARWERGAIAAGEPIVLAATSEHWTPQMLNLDRLDAISFAKGCYTGQEIVARTQHLGRVKRRMFRYRASTFEAPIPGSAVVHGSERVGEVVRSAQVADGAEVLAVVPLEARPAELRTEAGARLVELPLPYPLE